MLSNIRLTAFICVLSFLHGAIFTVALPTDSQISEPTDGSKVISLSFGPTEHWQPYNLTKLSSGTFARTYEVVDGYSPNANQPRIPAIVKLLPSTGRPEKNEQEIHNLWKVRLLLWNGHVTTSLSTMTLIVMKDVRKDYPIPGASTNLFHDWYRLKGKRADILADLKTARTTARTILMHFARGAGLKHYDCHMGNFFLTENLSRGVPIDWAPPDYDSNPPLAGVIPVPVDESERESDIQVFENWLTRNLMYSFSLQQVENQLQVLNDHLSPEHAALLPGENRKLGISP